MRYHFKKPDYYLAAYGETYICDHPVYDRCTLYREDSIGLAVIQQRHDDSSKHTWWSEIDPWLIDALYLQPGFYEFFKERARTSKNGLFPTVTIRQIMWALKMKPLKRERWETVFDKRDI